jgi:hypothetical protein
MVIYMDIKWSKVHIYMYIVSAEKQNHAIFNLYYTLLLYFELVYNIWMPDVH